jgi:cholesterol transport system auxiliary component
MKIYFSNNIMNTSQIQPRLASGIFFTLLLVSAFGLTGCISRPALNKQTFTFSAPAISATNVVAGDRVLGIRNLQIAAPFEGRSFVYRTGEFSYVRDPYAEFLGPPAEELLAPMRGWLRVSGNFIAVTEAGSALKPDLQVEISVSQLFGDFRQREHPSAVVTIRFVFFNAPNGVPGKVIFQREYSRRIPLSAPTAAALMEGWNQALAEILAEVSSGFRRSETGERFQ